MRGVGREPTTQLDLENAEQGPAGEERRLLWRDLGICSRKLDSAAQQSNEALSCFLKRRGLRAGLIENHFTQGQSRQSGLFAEKSVVQFREREEIVDLRSLGLDRRLGLDRDLLQRLVDGQEQQIALVLGVQEDGAQADPRAHCDLAHRRVVEPFRNKEALSRLLDAPQLVELVARTQAVTGSEHHLSHSSTFSAARGRPAWRAAGLTEK